jgi:hypothetical protein
LVNVSRESVILGRKVLEHGEHELIEAVERGAIAVSIDGSKAHATRAGGATRSG